MNGPTNLIMINEKVNEYYKLTLSMKNMQWVWKTVGGFTKRFRGVRSKERVNDSVGERISECAIEFNGDIYIVRGRRTLPYTLAEKKTEEKRKKERER